MSRPAGGELELPDWRAVSVFSALVWFGIDRLIGHKVTLGFGAHRGDVEIVSLLHACVAGFG
jgi:hypothetical protein